MITALYSVRAAAKATGLSPDTLRAWERRYGVITPTRGEDGRRRYAPADIERLRLLAHAVACGHTIGTIAQLDDDGLRELLTGASSQGEAGLAHVVEEIIAKVEALDAAGCERSLGMAIASLPIEVVSEEILLPALHRTGDRWARGELTVAHERMLSSIVRRLAMAALAGMARHTAGAGVVFGTLPGEDHELGSLLAAVNAASVGCRCEYVGTKLPGIEFARMARHLDAAAVAVSFVKTPPPMDSSNELAELCRGVANGVEVFVGGPAVEVVYDAERHPGATIVPDFGELRRRVTLLVH